MFEIISWHTTFVVTTSAARLIFHGVKRNYLFSIQLCSLTTLKSYTISRSICPNFEKWPNHGAVPCSERDPHHIMKRWRGSLENHKISFEEYYSNLLLVWWSKEAGNQRVKVVFLDMLTKVVCKTGIWKLWYVVNWKQHRF